MPGRNVSDVEKFFGSITGSRSTGMPPPMTGTFGLVTVSGESGPVVAARGVVSWPPSVTMITTSAAIAATTTTAQTTRTLACPRHRLMAVESTKASRAEPAPRSAGLDGCYSAPRMVERHKGNRRGLRRRAPRSQGGNALGARALAAILLAVALVVAAAATASAHPQRSSGSSAAKKPRWIVFAAQPPGYGAQQIFRIAPSGSGLKQLTKGAYPSDGPAFSPDGKRIAFARLGLGIVSMNVDGSGRRVLTKNGRDSFPAWSPDGKQIAFIRPAKSGWKVVVMSASGAGQRQLPKSPPAGRPSWTSKGLLVPTNGGLAEIDPQSGRVQKLFDALIDASVGMTTTAVSPDLSTVTFVESLPPDPGDTGCGEGVPCPRFALSIQHLRTHKAPRILVRNGGPASFSPDGKTLLYVAGKQLVLQGVASGTSTTIPTGNFAPTTGAPPVLQPR